MPKPFLKRLLLLLVLLAVCSYAGGDPINMADPTGASSNQLYANFDNQAGGNLPSQEDASREVNQITQPTTQTFDEMMAAASTGLPSMGHLPSMPSMFPQEQADPTLGEAFALAAVAVLTEGVGLASEMSELGPLSTLDEGAGGGADDNAEWAAPARFTASSGGQGQTMSFDLGGVESETARLAAETTLSSDIAATFSGGKYSSTVLQQDMVAYRYSGGISQPAGRFLTTGDTVSQISSPVSASIALNLPEGATAQTLNTFTIPAGTRIFTGGVAGGADTATQIFIRDPSVLIPH